MVCSNQAGSITIKRMTHISDIQIPHDDLPLWMRRARESMDWGIIVVSLISALIAWAFVMQPGLPLTNGSENYVYMTANYAEAIQEGRLYPRWDPYADYGYGAPVPHYTPPAAPYSAALVEIFFTANSVNAVRILYIVSLYFAGIMTYVFVLRESGARVAMIAAVAYVYCPYVGIVAPHIEGNLSVVMASALLPMLLWGTNRHLRINGAFDFMIVVLVSASLILTESRWALASIGLALLFASYQVINGKSTFRRWIHLFIGIAIGIMLSSFYWFPALLEQNLVRWQNNTLLPQPFMLSWRTLLTPLPRIDLNELLPTPHYALGLPISIIAIVSLAIIIRVDLIKMRKLSFSGLFFFTGLILTVVTVIWIPDQLWLLGVISFCFALGASSLRHIYETLAAPRYQRLFTPLILVTILTLSAPVWLSPRLNTTIDDTSAEAQINYEISGYGIAASPRYADFPITTAPSTQISLALLNGYSSDLLSRIPLDQRSLGREFDVIQAESHQDQYQVCINQTATLNVLRAYFAGWEVNLQNAPAQATRSCTSNIGQPTGRASLYPEVSTGLIALDIPGTNQQRILTITLGDTNIRRAAWLISWASLATIILISLFRMRQAEITTYIYFPMPDVSEARLLFLVVVAFTAVLITFALPSAPLTLYAAPGYSLSNTIAAPNHRTNEGIQLISYQLNRSTFSPDDTLDLFLAWRKNSNDALRENFRVQVHIRDPLQHIRWQESPYQQPGSYPTRRWIRGFFVSDRYQLPLENLIPGEYEVVIEVYVCEPDCVANRRVTFFDENQQIGQEFVLPIRIVVR